MTILENIETVSKDALKSRDSTLRGIYATLIGEIKMVAKNDGNRIATDEDSLKVIRKFIKNVEDNIRQLSNLDRNTATQEYELNILTKLLPKQITEDEIREWATQIIEGTYEPVARTVKMAMGHTMGMLKQHFGSALNPAVASKVVREILGG